ncbi:hypothetical protein D3C84_686140 [compost metagenome]
MGVDGCDQRLRIEPQQTFLLPGSEFRAVTRPDIEFRGDGKQSIGRCFRLQLDQFAPRLQHFGEPRDLVLAQLIATCGTH